MQLHHGKTSVKDFMLKGPISTFIPMLLLLTSPMIIARLLPYNSPIVMKDFAVGAGMTATMLFFVSFFLTGRFPFVTAKRGVDITLMLHRALVGVALVLSIAHVFLIASFSMPDNMGLIFIGLLLIVLQFIIAKIKSKVKFKYEVWRAIHGYFATFIISIVVFHAISEGKYSEQSILKFYWIILWLLAVGSLVYVHHLLPILNARKPYRIIELKEIANKQWNLIVEPIDHDGLQFKAGQFAFVSFGWNPFRSICNPFSISSSPESKPQISFTIKEVGDLTKKIGSLSKEQKVYLYGPYGHFNRETHRGPKNLGKGSIMIAGGIGITPIMSMIRDRKAKGDNYPIKLLYACQHEEDILYRAELDQLAKDDEIKLTYFLSKPNENWSGETGRIDLEYLRKTLDIEDYEHYLYFICGTSTFANQMLEHLEAIGGIPVFNIIYEDFSVYS